MVLKRIVAILLSNRRRRALVIAALILAAISPTASLYLITVVIGELTQGVVRYDVIWMFFVGALLSVISIYTATKQWGVVFEIYLHERRQEIEQYLATIDLRSLERLGPDIVLDTVSTEFRAASDGSSRVPNFISATIVLALSSLILLFLVPVVFLVFVLIFVSSGLLLFAIQRVMVASINRTGIAEATHLGRLRELVGGAKEVRLHNDRRTDLLENFVGKASESVRSARVKQIDAEGQLILLVNAITWFSVFFIIALLPLYTEDLTFVVQAVYIGIFVRAYFLMSISDFPGLLRVSLALQRIDALQHDLSSAPRVVQNSEQVHDQFDRISFNGIEFAYGSEDAGDSFLIGPVSLEIERGEVVFLVGSNGAGKSTFLKLATLLYQPRAGEVWLDNEIVSDAHVAAYRTLFSVVYTDYFLFDRLYGLQGIDDVKANAMLARLGLSAVVKVEDGKFSSIDLSSGQRQRLALAVALLEDRPILVLDEIAADQDPAFRRHIYDELLPALKREGRTLLVVSHDDRFFGLADKLVVFEEGEVTVKRQGASNG